MRNKPIFEVLQGIDEAVGALISAAGPAAECIVLAPTDFQRNGSWQHLMPEVIARINARLSTQFGRSQLLNRLLSFKVVLKVLRRLRRHRPEAWWRNPGTWPCAILPFNDNAFGLTDNRQRGREAFQRPLDITSREHSARCR